MQFLAQFFKFEEKNTNWRRELMAGFTGFVTVCYVVLVIPAMLADAGMNLQAATIAVIWATAFASLLMGLVANFPVIVAPGLGICAFFSYYVCGPMGLSWQTALAAVFISGVIFFLLTVTKIRQLIIDAVPTDIKHAIVVGLGCFISFIGLKNAGLIVADPSTFVALGNLHKAEPLLAALGVLLISALMVRRIKGAMIIGILAVTILGLLLGVSPLPDLSTLRLSTPSSLTPSETFFELDFNSVFAYGIVTIVFTLTMVDLFDNMGTLIGLSIRANMLDHKTGHIEGLEKALFSDSVATMASGVIGTPTCTSYIESAAAIAEGGRTGIVPIVSAILFLLCLFALPFVTVVPAYATASALIVVGGLMMQSVVHINFKDFSTGMPAFLTIITMPLTFNVATGFGLGFISYVFLKLLTNQNKDLNIVTILVALAFGINFMMR